MQPGHYSVLIPIAYTLRFSPVSLTKCGTLFKSLCGLGDQAKMKVVNAGALPLLCRLAHRDSYDDAK